MRRTLIPEAPVPAGAAETKATAELRAARAEAVNLRDRLFEIGLRTPKDERAPVPEGVVRFLGGIFQNCGRHYTEATIWYQAATAAYEAGQYRLGQTYSKRGDEAFARGEECTSWW